MEGRVSYGKSVNGLSVPSSLLALSMVGVYPDFGREAFHFYPCRGYAFYLIIETSTKKRQAF